MIKTEYSFRDKDTGLVLLEFTTYDLLLDFKKFVICKLKNPEKNDTNL